MLGPQAGLRNPWRTSAYASACERKAGASLLASTPGAPAGEVFLAATLGTSAGESALVCSPGSSAAEFFLSAARGMPTGGSFPAGDSSSRAGGIALAGNRGLFGADLAGQRNLLQGGGFGRSFDLACRALAAAGLAAGLAALTSRPAAAQRAASPVQATAVAQDPVSRHAPAAVLAGTAVGGAKGVLRLAPCAGGSLSSRPSPASAGCRALELASGERLAIALPAGASLDSVAATTVGWVVAGTEPAAGGPGSELLLLAGSLPPGVGAAGGVPGAGATQPLSGAGNERTVAREVPGAAAQPRRLPLPDGQRGAVRAEPLVLVEDGALAGLVWLEGAPGRTLGVRYAAWSGSSWAVPQTISPAGPGSQLALTAARLADGSWLVAWSGFDGEADEIVWSQGRNGVWSHPVAVADRPPAEGSAALSPRSSQPPHPPSITPALAAAGDGAVLAWSQLAHAGYRLLVARFTDGAWSAPVEAATGGALYPTFEASPEAQRLRLLYRDAARRSWTALDLDGAGRVLRRAALPGPAPGTAFDRPALLFRSAAGPADSAVFHWPGGDPQPMDQAAAWASPTPGTQPDAAGQEQETAAQRQPAPADQRMLSDRLTAADPRQASPKPAPAGPRSQSNPLTAAASPAPADWLVRSDRTGPARGPGGGSPKAASPVYIAFGDSITAGFGDSANEGGYPGRLQSLLSAATGSLVTVVNAGLFGETTGEGLSRIGSVLQPGATGLLLMEGTNDITARVSQSTTVQNLDAMASQAEALGIKVYHATIIPRLPTADFDATNDISAALSGAIRELAWERTRGLVDPFEVFFVLTPNYTDLYVGGTDKLHPNPAGYTLLAQTFADVLEGIDSVPPVPGLVSPPQGQDNVAADSEVEVDLYDFGAGIDVANTQLLINNQVINTTPTGDQRKLEFRYQPSVPLVGVVNVGVQTQDLASPPNTFNGTLSRFIIAGTVFLTGDLNFDGIVDGLDLLLFAPCFGAHRYNTNFQVECDLNGDGIIDGLDLAILAANFGKRSF
jgi:lysophospholipase L1-like esterase